jgi:hypothetical protein
MTEELESFDIDWDDTGIEHPDLPSSTAGQIYTSTCDKRTAVINSTDYTFAVREISHTNTSVEWKCFMGTANAIWLESFSISGELPLPVVACFSVATETSALEELAGLPLRVTDLISLDDVDTLLELLHGLTVEILEGRYTGEFTRAEVRTYWFSKSGSAATEDKTQT